ncbi:MAG: hypothetical protein C5B59_13660 [Bacteroidetes bacterium]|nr:MAG: hypothetical protein C5B59_13660 [Bacteroidota bacterium]
MRAVSAPCDDSFNRCGCCCFLCSVPHTGSCAPHCDRDVVLVTLEGIDVAYPQQLVRWQGVKNDGKHFAAIKATEGLSIIDPYIGHNWTGARANGLYRIAYHFFYDSLDPINQCRFFHNAIRSHGRFLVGDGVLVDVEEASISSPSTALEKIVAFVECCLVEINKAVIIYTNPDTWINILGNRTDTILSQCPLWLASYGPGVSPIKNWPNGLSFWQYSETGTCMGVDHPVDLDRFYGTEKQLRNILWIQ